MTNKTLIGKDEYLFLNNDSAKELEVHCNNLNLVQDKNLKRYKFKNFCLIVFPNKSLMYKDYLPDEYKSKFRPALDTYVKVLKDKMIDTYDVLKTKTDVYYKTDTHINIKGSYIVYKHFIQKINEIYNLNIKPANEVQILSKTCILSQLQLGIGDLLWGTNLGNQVVNNHMDTFYYSDDIEYIYCKYKIQKDGELRILDKQFIDQNYKLHGSILDWNILTNYILHKKNISDNKLKVLIFYDSFLTSLLSLYLDLFEEVYMIKEIYNNEIIDILKPDFVFEFRVERFLF
jgi:hypothetical protein